MIICKCTLVQGGLSRTVPPALHPALSLCQVSRVQVARRLMQDPASSPAIDFGNRSSNTGSGPAAGSAACAGGNQTFAGFPKSGGLLQPELQPLLLAIQQAHLFEDSKTAVDLVLNGSVQDTLAAFNRLQSERGGNISSNVSALEQFVNTKLSPAGSDLQTCTAPDWQEQPPNFLPSLTAKAQNGSDPNATQLLQFGLQVHRLWNVLCREVTPDVLQNPQRHSLLPLPNRTVVPGDRFRETYYWDSYWVARGLLVSGMTDTATSLVDNLLAMLRAVGHVPNGARVYYLNRSQPPLLSAMVRAVYEATNDTQLLEQALPLLLQEHSYWASAPKQVQVQAANGTVHNLSRYWADWFQPRPESYREDVETALNDTGSSSTDNPAAAALYHQLASGAESGWDYSSRWFADNRTLATIRTTQIVPADLNAFLYQLERNIAWAANLTGNAALSQRFNEAAASRKKAMQALLWDEQAGMWRDGILSQPGNTTRGNTSQVYTLTQNPGLFASNFIPLWAGLTEGNATQGAQVVAALQNSSLIGPSGVATTAYQTGQQWDYPNGWPPLQHMIIEGADRHGGPSGAQFAAGLARTWVMMNMRIFNETGHMHEKYDVSTTSGLVGRGGEYRPQVGFGWSNGVVLDLLKTYF